MLRKLMISILTIFFASWTTLFPLAAHAWDPGVWNPTDWNVEELQKREWKVPPLSEREWAQYDLLERTIAFQELTKYEWMTQSPELLQWVMTDLDNQQWIIENHDIVRDSLQERTDLTQRELTVMEWQLSELREYSITMQELQQRKLDELNSPSPSELSNQELTTNTELTTNNLESRTSNNTIENIQSNLSNLDEKKGKFNLSAKDGLSMMENIIKETVSFVYEIHDKDDVTFKDYLSHRNGLFLGVGKTILKNNSDAMDTIFDGVDAVKSGAEAIKMINTIRGAGSAAETAGQVGTVTRSAAQVTGNVAQAGSVAKTLVPASAFVSTAFLPMTIYATVQDVKSISGTSGMERTDAIMSTIGNAGSVIAGLAAPVALIPGAQPIAAGMLAVGAAASAVSLGYSAFRNRKKIVKGGSKLISKIGGLFGR